MAKSLNTFSIKNLTKQFNGNVVLNKLNLEIKPMESLVILGPSGIGKSVLIRTMIGLMRPNSGDILFNGKSTLEMTNSERKDFYRQIGMLFQESALFDSLSVFENIMFGPMMNENMERDSARKHALELLKHVGMTADDLDKGTSELSGGMKKRVALARAMALNPSVLFFDEPTTGLDPIMAATITNLIHTHIRRLKTTTITITHDLMAARTIADRIIMLQNGHVEWSGTYNDLFKSKNKTVRAFLEPWRAAGMVKPLR